MDNNDNKKAPKWTPENDEEPIHTWFGLTYAQYLVLPRTALQSMPSEWQRRFVKCLNELSDAVPEEYLLPDNVGYTVSLKEDDGKYISIKKHDPLFGYERGRRIIPLRVKEKK
jgi:hypothetical protein